MALLFVYAINFKSFVTFNYFINQTEIAELFCINKDKPQLQCDGKCHLATQLEEVETNHDDAPFSQSTTNYNLEVNSILSENNKVVNYTYKLVEDISYFNSHENLCKGFFSINSPPPKV